MNINKRDELIIRAAIEFSPDPFYEIRNGTLGLTLYAEVETQSAANEIRKKNTYDVGGSLLHCAL